MGHYAVKAGLYSTNPVPRGREEGKGLASDAQTFFSGFVRRAQRTTPVTAVVAIINGASDTNGLRERSPRPVRQFRAEGSFRLPQPLPEAGFGVRRRAQLPMKSLSFILGADGLLLVNKHAVRSYLLGLLSLFNRDLLRSATGSCYALEGADLMLFALHGEARLQRLTLEPHDVSR